MPNQIKGKEFVFTGRISITRHEAWILVERCGGSIGTSITYDTDYAVVGEAAGAKFDKAKDRGVEILNEDTFFIWVNEALLEIPVIVTAPVLPKPEEPDTPVDIKEWIKGATCFQCENCGNAFAVHPPTLFPQCPLCINETDMSMFSFNNPQVLERIKKENLGLVLAPPMKCLGCGILIPYSIYTNPLMYYCFHCRYYYTRIDHSVHFEAKNGVMYDYEPGWKVGLVKDCADLYTLTRKLLYGGTDWQYYKEQPQEGVCMINETGRALVMSTAEAYKTEELDNLRDLGNSAELAVDILRDLQEMAASSVAIELVNNIKSHILTPEESPEDYEKFTQSRMRKEQRHEKKAQERFDKRRERTRLRLGPLSPENVSSSSPSSLPAPSTEELSSKSESSNSPTITNPSQGKVGITKSEVGSYLKPPS